MRYNKSLFKTMGLVCLALFSFSTYASAQQSLALIQQHLNNYRSNALQEKLYVHTDKNFYQAGEIMWFKIYSVDASFHLPLDFSKVVYVEVLDKKNHPVLQAKLPMDSSSGSGSFYVPVNINSGNYTLRAYTNWMKNYSADYFFEKTITLVNSQKITDSAATSKLNALAYDVRFFPEGGNLVAGLQSKLAFKATDQYGRGANFSGKIVNENGDSITVVRPLKFGIGNVIFTPEQNHIYKAIVHFDDGKLIETPLPAAYKDGYVMRVTGNDANTLNINVNTNTNSPSEVYLVAQTRQVVKVAVAIALQGGSGNYVIDKSKLGTGITQLTLFNALRQPVCERLCFNYPARDLDLQMTLDKEKYTQRSKVSLAVNVANNEINSAEVSLAVYKIDSLQQPDETTISNYLWLSSDIKGYVESPGYYFSNNHQETAEAMDNLMLTHGWRRFKWENVLQDKLPFFNYEPELRTHIINGKVVAARNGEAASNVECYLSVPGTRSLFLSNISDDSGHVSFELKNMYGSAEIIVQPNPQNDSVYRVDIISPFSENYAEDIVAPFQLPMQNPVTLIDQSVGVQVQNIYAGSMLKRVSDAGIDTAMFYGNPDLSYLLDNYVRFTTMEEVLREYVQFVNIRKKGSKFHLDVFDAGSQQMMDEDPLVLLDGVPVFDMDKLIAFDPLKVKRLDVLTRKYFFGYSVYNGLLNLVTYSGNMPGYELDPHATVIDYESMQMQREFYSPIYDSDEAVASHLPDFRNVLYWNPHIRLYHKTNDAFSFYTSDKKGKYVIVAEGLSKSGTCGTGIKYFEVE